MIGKLHCFPSWSWKVTNIERFFIITCNKTIETSERSTFHRCPRLLMPRGGTWSMEKAWEKLEVVGLVKDREIARAVTSKEDMTSQVILHRKTKGVKFNSTIIVPSELTNINEIFNYIGGYKNIMKMKWAMMGRNNAMAYVGNRNRLAITNVNRWK
ncbi:hypothetical protein Tco_1093796 [Tanacetum coccineum]|uniref:Uncharacterized protein n=1 Tax=Tanacetum coccineum TaxID=301880 RepID=A0ABQ5IDT3_9ASTR